MSLGVAGDVVDPADEVLGVLTGAYRLAAAVHVSRAGFGDHISILHGTVTLIADGAEGEPAAARHCNAFAEVAFLAATRERNGFDDRAVEIHLHAVDRHDGIELSGKFHRTTAGRQMIRLPAIAH